MKQNIAIISLVDNFSSKIAESLSLSLGMYYANLEDIIAYEILNMDEIKEKCGEEYLENLKKKVVGDVLEYENAVISLPLSICSKYNLTKTAFDKTLVIYLKFSKEEFDKIRKKNYDGKVRAIAFATRDKYLAQNSDIIIPVTNFGQVQNIKKIKREVVAYFTERGVL